MKSVTHVKPVMQRCIRLFVLFSISLLLTNISKVSAQSCPTDLKQGQNLVTNSDFSDDYNGWNHDPAYTEFSGGFSVPGKILVGTNPNVFNSAFMTY